MVMPKMKNPALRQQPGPDQSLNWSESMSKSVPINFKSGQPFKAYINDSGFFCIQQEITDLGEIEIQMSPQHAERLSIYIQENMSNLIAAWKMGVEV